MRKYVICCLVVGFVCLSAGLVSAGQIKDAPILSRLPLDCMDPISIACGDDLAGSNIGATNEVDLYGCIGYGMSGGEVVYELIVDLRRIFDIHLIPDECDLGLFLLGTCDEYNCLIHSDGIVPLDPEHITYELWPGTYYIVVDGYIGEDENIAFECDFELSVECSEPIWENYCDLVMEPSCNGVVYGDFTGSANHFSDFMDGCGGPPNIQAFGAEDWYSVRVNPGGFVYATVLFEQAGAALWIFDSCVEPFDCLSFYSLNYTSAGGSYENTTDEANEIFIVVDSNFSGGPYALTLNCTGDVVPTEHITWDKVKVLFR